MFSYFTVRLRSELQAELQKSSIKSEADHHQQARQQLAGSLVQEIESHTCPICYDLMVAPQNAPILLFPCGRLTPYAEKPFATQFPLGSWYTEGQPRQVHGHAGHTFCSVCIASHTQRHKKRLCPCCREVIHSQVRQRCTASPFSHCPWHFREVGVDACRRQTCLCSSLLLALQRKASNWAYPERLLSLPALQHHYPRVQTAAHCQKQISSLPAGMACITLGSSCYCPQKKLHMCSLFIRAMKVTAETFTSTAHSN